MKKSYLYLLAAIAVLLIVWGCAAPAAPEPTKAPPPAGPAPTTAAAPKGKARIGLVVSATPPRAYYKDGDPKKGLEGIEVELMNKVAQCMNVQTEYMDVAWSGLFTGLLSNKWDWAASAVFIRKDRAAMMDFADPYMDSDVAFMVRKGTKLKTFADLKDKTLCADTGAGSELWLRENLAKYGPYKIQTYNGVADVWNDVLAGRCDGGLGDSPAVEFFVKNYPDKLEPGLYLGLSYKCAIAFRPGDPMIPEFNRCQRELKKSGEMSALYKKYYGADPQPGSATVELFTTPYKPDK